MTALENKMGWGGEKRAGSTLAGLEDWRSCSEAAASMEGWKEFLPSWRVEGGG